MSTPCPRPSSRPPSRLASLVSQIIQLWGVKGGGSARSMAEDLHAEGKKLPPVENEDELMELIQWDPPKIAAGDECAA